MDTEATLIGGERRLAKSGEYIDSINPATGEVIGRVPRLGAEDVADAITAAAQAAPGWRDTPPQARIRAVLDLADRVEARAEELAQIDVADNGTPIWVMRIIARMAATNIRYAANVATEVKGETYPDESDRLTMSVHEPYGVVARLVPFNHPFMMATVKIAPALVMGNSVLLKPSEHTSLSALALIDDFVDIFPPGVVNIVTGYGAEVGNAILDSPTVRRIAFVGGAATGQAIQERAARSGVKHVSLELGGKNPIVIFPDADLDAAVDAVVKGMNFGWQGESCASTSRLLVHEDIHDELVARVAARIDALTPGDPRDENSQTGAIVTKGQYEKVLKYIELGNRDGRLVAGGGRPSDPALSQGLFIRPTLFDQIDPGAQIAQEEIFGPVLVAMKFKNYEDAVRIANGTEYGLTASVFTRDFDTAHRFTRDVEAGYVWVNDVSRLIPGTPYGGVKNSGIGREGSLEELYSYVTTKNVTYKFAR